MSIKNAKMVLSGKTFSRLEAIELINFIGVRFDEKDNKGFDIIRNCILELEERKQSKPDSPIQD